MFFDVLGVVLPDPLPARYRVFLTTRLAKGVRFDPDQCPIIFQWEPSDPDDPIPFTTFTAPLQPQRASAIVINTLTYHPGRSIFTFTIDGQSCVLRIREVSLRAMGVRIVPKFKMRPAASASDAIPVALHNLTDASTSSSSTTVRVESGLRYLVLPGNYSGDQWAVGAALLFDDQLRVVVPSRTGDTGAFGPTKDQFIEFCTDIQIANVASRVIEADLDTGGGTKVSHTLVATTAEARIQKDLAARGKRGADPICGWTFASTSIIMAAAERLGLANVFEKLRSTFAKRDDAIDARVAELRQLAAGQRCLLVNMRIGKVTNHPQHNITPTIYTQICDLAKQFKLKVIRIGGYQSSVETPQGDWMNSLAEPVIEIFEKGVRARRSSTAYFWKCVADMPEVFGVIGGRSGSLDIVSFMRGNVFCWDVIDPAFPGHHEYIRQFLMFPMQSLGRREGIAQFDNRNPKPPGKLQAADVIMWLSGRHVMPDHVPFGEAALAGCCRLSELTGKGNSENKNRLMMSTLDYIRPFVEGNFVLCPRCRAAPAATLLHCAGTGWLGTNSFTNRDIHQDDVPCPIFFLVCESCSETAIWVGEQLLCTRHLKAAMAGASTSASSTSSSSSTTLPDPGFDMDVDLPPPPPSGPPVPTIAPFSQPLTKRSAFGAPRAAPSTTSTTENTTATTTSTTTTTTTSTSLATYAQTTTDASMVTNTAATHTPPPVHTGPAAPIVATTSQAIRAETRDAEMQKVEPEPAASDCPNCGRVLGVCGHCITRVCTDADCRPYECLSCGRPICTNCRPKDNCPQKNRAKDMDFDYDNQ
jgi:hypothetical protein